MFMLVDGVWKKTGSVHMMREDVEIELQKWERCASP